jgi:cytochrome P450
MTVAATYDLLSPEHFAAPYETFAVMRERDPLYWCEPMGMWFVTRYEDVHAVTRDRRFSSDKVDFFVPPGGDERSRAVRRFLTDWMVFCDPPEHTRLRKLVSRAFTPRSVAMLESFTARAAQEALDRVSGKDQIDVLADFGLPVPSRVIAHMLGVAPDRVDDFEQWSGGVARVLSLVGDQGENIASAYEAIGHLAAYFHDLIAERRAAPAGDLLSILVQPGEDGSVLSEHEVMASCALLLISGHETTTHQIGNAALALLRHPGELARLRAEPGLAGSAVEELVRYDGALAGLARTAQEDVPLSGGVVPAGTNVMAVVLSANRDPAVFADPDRLDIGRGDMRHLGFGGGVHACVGAALARLETRIAMTALLARYPRIELAVSDPDPTMSWVLNGVTSLPVNVS